MNEWLTGDIFERRLRFRKLILDLQIFFLVLNFLFIGVEASKWPHIALCFKCNCFFTCYSGWRIATWRLNSSFHWQISGWSSFHLQFSCVYCNPEPPCSEFEEGWRHQRGLVKTCLTLAETGRKCYNPRGHWESRWKLWESWENLQGWQICNTLQLLPLLKKKTKTSKAFMYRDSLQIKLCIQIICNKSLNNSKYPMGFIMI